MPTIDLTDLTHGTDYISMLLQDLLELVDLHSLLTSILVVIIYLILCCQTTGKLSAISLPNHLWDIATMCH